MKFAGLLLLVLVTLFGCKPNRRSKTAAKAESGSKNDVLRDRPVNSIHPNGKFRARKQLNNGKKNLASFIGPPGFMILPI